MALSTSLERKGIVVTWTEGLDHDGEVQLFFSRELPNGETDVSNTDPRANDGDALVSVPYAFAGSTHGQVKDLDGNVLDEGPVEIN